MIGHDIFDAFLYLSKNGFGRGVLVPIFQDIRLIQTLIVVFLISERGYSFHPFTFLKVLTDAMIPLHSLKRNEAR